MTEQTTELSEHVGRGGMRFQTQDFAWLLFMGALFAAAPEKNYNALILVPLIAAFQIAEPRLRVFASRRGQIISTVLKMLLSYLLVGWTHGIASPYDPVFLIPVISAATLFELPGVIAVVAIAAAGYLSFLSPIFFDEVPPGYLSLISLRVSFYAIIGILVYQQAHAKREEMRRTQEAVARLVQTNRHLQEAQASLRRSERLAALGQLTAGLAHELRNPLGTIKASAEMLTRPAAKSQPEVMDEMAGYISSEVDRMNGLVASFLDFARPLQINPAEADLQSVVEDVVREQSELARECGVTIRTEVRDRPFAFEFDRDLLRVALSNLIQNAIQASSPKQEVSIEASIGDQDALISIRDYGAGIQAQHLESIFNPFFTTKPKGVGLGLALVAKIIDEHGGRIQVSSELGKGTVFEIMLPRHSSGSV
ncbi:MAG: ATP-binding protein [Acidobacteriota bacterium]|nr:ATP-binding protein [Acidobacteriota bacterium]